MSDHIQELLNQVSALLAKFRKARSELARLPKWKVQLEVAVKKRNRKVEAIQSEATGDQTELQRRIKEAPEAAEVVRIYERIQSLLFKVPRLHHEMNLLLSRVKAACDELAPYILEVRGVPQEPEIANLDSIIVLLEDMLKVSPTPERTLGQPASAKENRTTVSPIVPEDRATRSAPVHQRQATLEVETRDDPAKGTGPGSQKDTTSDLPSKGDAKLLQNPDGTPKNSVSYDHARLYLGVTRRQVERLVSKGEGLAVIGRGHNKQITVSSLLDYLPAKKTT